MVRMLYLMGMYTDQTCGLNFFKKGIGTDFIGNSFFLCELYLKNFCLPVKLVLKVTLKCAYL